MTKKINIEAIRIDGGTQSRVEINEEAVARYADAIEAGDTFPAVVVFHDGADHWLADGFHRWHAHRKVGRASIDADVRNGSRRDAVLFSFSANKGHGLPPNNADKRKIVTAMLQDDEWSKWSDREIARTCGFSHEFVRQMRASICQPLTDAPTVRTVERAGKVYQQDTSRIGKSEPAPAPTPSEKPAKRTLENHLGGDPELTDGDELTVEDKLTEMRDTVSALAEENDRLRDKLAVESMDASEEAKTEAADTIRDLRAQVKTLEAELDAVKVSRDTYMRENGELKKQVKYWERQVKKAGGQ